MNNLFNITFNGLNDIDDLGIMATTRPNIPTPVRKIQEKECNGRDGKLHQDLGGYDDMELMISYNFSSRDKYFEILRKLKRWTNHIEDNMLNSIVTTGLSICSSLKILLHSSLIASLSSAMVSNTISSSS